MRVIAIVCGGLLLLGCAASGRVVRCDGRLEPINASAVETLPVGASPPRAEKAEQVRAERE